METEIGILSKLPTHLSYLAAPAMKYGVNKFDEDIDRFLSLATEEEIEELASLAERVRLAGHYSEVIHWLEEYDTVDHKEASNLYFLFGVLDAADLAFD